MQTARAAFLRHGLLALAITLVLGFLVSHHAEGLAQHSGVSAGAHADAPLLASEVSGPASAAPDLLVALTSQAVGLGHDVLGSAAPDGHTGHLGLLSCVLALAALAVFVRQVSGHDGTVARPASSVSTPQPAVAVGGREALVQHGVLRI